jgi:hypothetical protein
MNSPSKLGLAILVLPLTLLAQWPDHRTTGAPRTPNGKVRMDGPPPRTPDGHPDFSGVWDRGMPGTSFLRLPSVVPDGLPYQPWAAQLAKQREASHSVGHPDAHCLPLHPVQLHTHPQPRKIVQTPTEVIVIYESNGGLRQFFLDGRALPKPNDVVPWWFGYSVGHWDGDVLVVETIGFRDDMWLDEGSGAPGTSALKLTERFTRPVYGRLEIEITIDDPKAYTKPFGFKITQALMPDTELIEFICAENEQSVKHFK